MSASEQMIPYTGITHRPIYSIALVRQNFDLGSAPTSTTNYPNFQHFQKIGLIEANIVFPLLNSAYLSVKLFKNKQIICVQIDIENE